MTQLQKQTDAPLFDVAPSLSKNELSKIATSVNFLPRVQLFGGSAAPVKRQKFPIGHFGLVTAKDQIEDLGEEFDFLPLQVRAHAMDMSRKAEGIYVNSFDMASDLFQNIA